VELIITHQRRLTVKHGLATWEQIKDALDSYLDVIASTGNNAELLFLDDLGDENSTLPRAIKTKLQELIIKNEAASVLFLGGDDVIPFYRLPDQTPDEDLDKYILSDSYYVDFNESEHDHWPEIATGRMPDGSDGQLLIKMLYNAADAHRNGGIKLSNQHLGFSTDTWLSASQIIYRRVDLTGKTLHASPPTGLADFDGLIGNGTRSAGSLLFFNVHGHRSQPVWWGEQKFLSVVPLKTELVNYDSMKKSDLSNSVILCEACHGAAIAGRKPENSLALCALQQGALGFFGCTAKSYAVTLPSGKPSGVSGVDAVFAALIFNLLKDKRCFGEALCDAKQRHTFHNAFDEKNLLGIVLLGDPLLHFV